MMANQPWFSNTDAGNKLVVVHGTGGHLTKGTLEWDAPSDSIIPRAPLPDRLHIKSGGRGEHKTVLLSEAKAVFFVKSHESNDEHDEVRFFDEMTPNYVWIRVQFADGELLEGRTGNSPGLLSDPGIWLQPFDMTGNNSFVYIPKTSIVDFHVVGVSDLILDRE